MAGLAPSLALSLTAPTSTSILPLASTISLSHLSPPPLPPTPSTMAGWIAWVFTFVFSTIPSVLYWVITFTTITLPTWLFTLFSMSLTFTMNFTTLMLILLVLGSTIGWFIRYRFLNMYSRLPPEPPRKEAQIDLFPDIQEGDSKPGLANYLDEFLSAIKVFGYLERPVFHELTRTMQTRKLIAGETLMLEEEKGFCMVVDGLVQIFVKSSRERKSNSQESLYMDDESSDEEEHRTHDRQGYQLLTEVKNGASMSSLFSILQLFTEDIELRNSQSHESSVSSPIGGQSPVPDAVPMSPDTGVLNSPRSNMRAGSGYFANRDSGDSLPPVPLLHLEESHAMPGADQIPQPESKEKAPKAHKSQKKRSKSVHPDIVARATVDTTIAIIPASAFRRLTRTYPRATSHIVQVILTRLQRVTLATAYSYLGLSKEVLGIERQMSKYTSWDLPNSLRGSALDRLKDKFMRERDRLGPEEIGKGIALHNPSAGRRRRSNSTLRKEAVLQAKLANDRSPVQPTPLKSPSTSIERDVAGVSPGDLLSTIQHSRFGPRYQHLATRIQTPLTEREQPSFLPAENHRPSNFQRKESVDEDSIFRESILDCIMNGMGLNESTRDTPGKGSHSGDTSPRLLSFDNRRQKAVFSNAFGFIDPYEGSGDGETESMMSMSVTSAGGTSPITNLREDLRHDIEIVYFPQGSVLVEQGERHPGLYYVIDGFLDVGVPVEKHDESLVGSSHGSATQAQEELFPKLRRTITSSSRVPGTAGSSDGRRKTQSRRSLYLIKPGGIQGYVGALASYPSYTDVVAKTDVYVGFLPRASLERIAERHPAALLTLAKRLTRLLPRLLLHIDFALEWVQVSAGQVIYHQGDESDAIYIVLNGRLRSVLEGSNGKVTVIGEHGQGESVGELEVMTESTRPSTLHAIRETELAKFPRSLFNSLAQEHPGITIQVSKLIAQRMRDLVEHPLSEKGIEQGHAAGVQTATSTLNLRTVAILPVMAGVPVVEFGNRLMQALHQTGVTRGVTSLNQAAILNHLGRHAFSKMGKLKLSQYLADLEEKFSMVLYIADTSVNSPWTQTCIAQADCILLVGLAESSPRVGEYERFLLGMKTTARKELVLLHAERYCPPGLTREWLKKRMWINGGHHHVQMAFRSADSPSHPPSKKFGTVLKQRVQILQAEIQKYTSRRAQQTPLYSVQTPFKGDFHRLARRLCGKRRGARGIAHVGVIKALEEAGIPVDIIGGTSIGSFIGALYARDADVVPMYGRAKKFSGRMGSMWRFALDLTYPTVSYTTGHEFNRGIFKTFGDSQIEDFWLEFYCNTTNISRSRIEYHSSGYVWRYVRASMTLAGLIPPICDEGSMLLDGGYIDNLTVAHMRSLGADIIFAVDVGSIDDTTPQGFGDSLSGFWSVFNRWNPFSSLPNPPTLSEIQARLAYVSSIDNLERAKNMPGCLYMRPPVDPYGTLEFGKFDEIYQVGYAYGREFLERLRSEGSLPIPEETEEKRKLQRTMAPRRASI
ncbi:Acyl transferase/acyl hydrolase/lysophospholipase [Penicillium sp. DV-2018c]|nr:Acyl transferase/acyl hydrolase/lysophospholipase [Penicillium sp. DV-2018c]KAJ5583174.1 Acyl transferase/acyl hydrolase/lysophospholipase [Penicillium sp. DV-2018c]